MTQVGIKAIIDQREIEVAEGTMVLEAARRLDIVIPTLCFHRRLKPAGACRVCMVELAQASNGRRTLVPACSHPLSNGDEVFTQTPKVHQARRFVVALLAAQSPQGEAVEALAKEYGVQLRPDSPDPLFRYLGQQVERRRQESGEAGLTRCMLCGLCTRVCAEVVGAHAISMVRRGRKRRVRPPFMDVSKACIGCGSCAWVCPNKAIRIEPAT